MDSVGALVTLDLPADSRALTLPWIITFGPLHDDEEWEPVVCGPYERPHALALAESVVADEELMAVVEPLQPYVSAERIRQEILLARVAAEKEAEADRAGAGSAPLGDFPEDARSSTAEPSPPPTEDDVRAGFARIAAQLTR